MHTTASPPENAIIEVIRSIVRDELARQRESLELVDQAASPLGRRRHVRVARRLLEESDPRAGRAGKRYFLTRAAIEEELRRLGREQLAEVEAADEDRADLLAELGITEAP